MKIIKSPREIQELVNGWRCSGETIGFVPTMGALHEGHLSLARAARQQNSKFIASVFVNPTQFGPNEDYTKYPRPIDHDQNLLAEAGCDVLFTPEPDEMYGRAQKEARSQAASGPAVQTWVEVSKLGEIWEGVVRPGHLRGVATVVAKLFNIVAPHRAYFGEKDYQQLKVIERMVSDLFFNIEIVPCLTVRESDGLALSSRNAYLAPDEREAAAVLSRSLFQGVELVRGGERDVTRLGAAVQKVCETQPLVSLQYIAVVDADTLSPLQTLTGEPARILIAARIGQTRLIDNVGIQ